MITLVPYIVDVYASTLGPGVIWLWSTFEDCLQTFVGF